MRPLMAFAGTMRSGKTTAADYLVRTHHYRKLSFASRIKQICREGFGVHGRNRGLFQSVGEAGRNNIDEDIWVNFLVRELLDLMQEGHHRFVVDDLRRENEFDRLRRLGFYCVLVECEEATLLGRKGYDPTKLNHPSETNVRDFRDKFDAVARNDNTIESYEDAVELLTRYSIPRKETPNVTWRR